MRNIDMSSRGYSCVYVRDALVCGELWPGGPLRGGGHSLGGFDGVLFLELAELGERRHWLRCAARHALDYCAREHYMVDLGTLLII